MFHVGVSCDRIWHSSLFSCATCKICKFESTTLAAAPNFRQTITKTRCNTIKGTGHLQAWCSLPIDSTPSSSSPLAPRRQLFWNINRVSANREFLKNNYLQFWKSNQIIAISFICKTRSNYMSVYHEMQWNVKINLHNCSFLDKFQKMPETILQVSRRGKHTPHSITQSLHTKSL